MADWGNGLSRDRGALFGANRRGLPKRTRFTGRRPAKKSIVHNYQLGLIIPATVAKLSVAVSAILIQRLLVIHSNVQRVSHLLTDPVVTSI
jgi:hypothetical protein